MKKFQFIFICILALMINFRFLLWHKYKTDEQNYRIKRQIFYLIFCRSAISFDKLKNSARHTINSFLKLKRRYLSPYIKDCVVLVQKLLSHVDLLQKPLQQSIPKNFLLDWDLESILGGHEVLFFLQASTLLLKYCG